MAKKKKSPKFVEAIKQNKVVRNTVLGITATVGVGALYSVFSGDKSPQSLDEQQAQELREMHKNEMHRVDSILNRKYKITDRASFDQLYRDALPLIQLSMFSTEVLVKEPYADANPVLIYVLTHDSVTSVNVTFTPFLNVYQVDLPSRSPIPL
jgi:hypothetical protein